MSGTGRGFGSPARTQILTLWRILLGQILTSNIMALIPPFFIDCVVAIGVSKVGQTNWIGTGFLFGYLIEKTPDNTNKYRVYLVTNKHVLNGQDSIIVRFNPTTDQSSKDYTASLKNPDNSLAWTGHSDPEVDVAVLAINIDLVRKEGIKCSFFESDKHVATIQTMVDTDIIEGEFVYTLGFPMGLVSKDRQHVFVRSGVIARVKDLFEKRSKDYVIDAPVFPGNSGGPVISKPEVSSIAGTKTHNKAELIGIVKSYIPYIDVAISQQTNRPRITFEENSGLSKVEPVDNILQTIEIAEKKNAPQQNV